MCNGYPMLTCISELFAGLLCLITFFVIAILFIRSWLRQGEYMSAEEAQKSTPTSKQQKPRRRDMIDKYQAERKAYEEALPEWEERRRNPWGWNSTPAPTNFPDTAEDLADDKAAQEWLKENAPEWDAYIETRRLLPFEKFFNALSKRKGE